MPPKPRSKSTAVAKKPPATKPTTQKSKASKGNTKANARIVIKCRIPTPRVAKTPASKVVKPKAANKPAPKPKASRVTKPKSTPAPAPSTIPAGPKQHSQSSGPQGTVADKATAYHAALGAISARLAAEPEAAIFFEIHMALDPALGMLYGLQ
ncbi:hypothetical protein LTR85_011232 [Meristemomyces frigidus]|nr:hypothetical protein LTR85_011232 [Meristemomyces frigidus]